MMEAMKIPSIGPRKVLKTKFCCFTLHFETFWKLIEFDNEVFKLKIKDCFKKQLQLTSTSVVWSPCNLRVTSFKDCKNRIQ